MSCIARRTVSLVLVCALVISQSSATFPTRVLPVNGQLSLLTQWRNEATSLLSNAWLALRSFVPVQSNPTLDDLRAGTPSTPTAPSSVNVTPPSGYDDPAATATASYLSQMSTRGQDTGIAGGKPMQSADPTVGNAAISGISHNLDSRNYSFTAPVLSLGGRAGLNMSLALTYNRRLWVGQNGQIAFNVERGFPAPGWRFGFGAIQGINNSGSLAPFTSTTTNKASFLYLAPDGTKRELGWNATTSLYESYDSSWLDFNATTKVLRTVDGTKVTFGETVTANGDYQYLPTEIKDRQGNFITVVYKSLSNSDRVIDYVLDTAGRRIDFYYEANRLREVRQDRNGTLFKYLTLEYQPVTINASEQLTPANANGLQVYVPTRITYPSGASFRFYYTSYLHVWLIEKWVPSIAGQGSARCIAYTYFRETSVAGVSTPAHNLSGPALADEMSIYTWGNESSYRGDWAEAWNLGNATLTYYSYGGAGAYQPPGYYKRLAVSGAQGMIEMFENTDEFFCGGPCWGLPRQLIYEKAGWDAPSLRTTELAWEADTGGPWQKNLRLKEKLISDPSGNSHYTNTTYSLIDGIRLPTQVEEAKTTSDPVYRRLTTTYTSYPTQRILGLPLEVSTYEGAGTKLVARTTNSYDQSGGYTDSNGLALNYLMDESAAQVIQHDNSNYTTSLTQRGNLTSVTQSGVNSSGTVTGSRVIARTGYDTNGNVRWTTDAAGNRAQLLYTDNFLNKPASVGNTQAFVYTAADPTGMRAGKQYDYWTGHLLKSFNLKPNSSTEEQIVTTSYDFADRPFQTTQPTGAWVKTFYWDNLLYLTTLQKTDTVGGVDQIGFSFTRTNGMGHTLGKGSDHPSAATGKYAGQQFVYNTRGEVSDQSNVQAMNASWTPIDEDAASGWLYQNYVYDELGKIISIARPDGNLYTIDRQGCGCAGATVTTTDERGCKVESKTDFLGRLESAKELIGYDQYGAPLYNNAALYTYDILGRLKQIDVKKGGSGPQTQTRTFVYDEYGRLTSETTPEAGTVTYGYTANDQIATKTDARGKITTLAYNTRNLMTSVSYNDSTPGATYGYDEFGARTSMTDGEGTMSYVFDTNRRLQSETRTFTGLTNQTFTLTYGYSAGGQLKTVNYGSSTGINKNVNYAYNSVGALTGVGTNLIGSDPNATTNVLSGIAYNGFGAVKTLHYGNGRRLTLTYDVNRHQMQTMKVDNQNGTDTIINKSYSYTSQKWDPVLQEYTTVNDGRIQQITDSVDANYTTSYSYDMFNRLTGATATAATRSYTYDEWGNLKTVVSNGATKTYNFTNNASGAPATNRINTVTGGGTVSYTWDAAGNMTGEGATTFQYDAAGRMVSVNSGGSGSYGFDGDGKRVKKTEGGVTVYYVESSAMGKTAFEMTSAGLNRALVIAGRSKVVALLATGGQFYWSHADHLGTGRKMTSTTGAVVYRGEFDPHGNSLLETGGTSLTNRKFTGYERDTSGLDYAQARMYTANRGRFISPDPAGLQAANFTLPQSLNRYAYTNNDPVNFIDPAGRCLIYWSQVNETYGYWDAVLCHDEIVRPQPIEAPPPPVEPPDPYLARLIKCVKDLFDVDLVSFAPAKEGGKGTFLGIGKDTLTKQGERTNILLTIDAQTYNKSQIETEVGRRGVAGFVRQPGSNPYQSYTAYVASNLSALYPNLPQISYAAQIHEVANALWMITGTRLGPLKRPGRGRDQDAGVRLERCVFNGEQYGGER